MMKKAFALVIILLLVVSFAGVAFAQGDGTVVASGFNGPMGVLVAPDGSIWVIDSGVGGDQEMPFPNPQTGEEVTAQFGETARIVQIAPDGTQTVAATLSSIIAGMDTIGGARLALLDGTLYATSGQLLGDPGASPMPNTAAVIKIEDGQVAEVASTWAVESSQNPDPNIYDSHPYGLAAGPDGNLWVTDAAGNDLLKVNPESGEVEVVTVFEGVPSPLPNPARGGAMESDPVPTGIAVDQSGNIFVAFLPGFPFLPGSAKVVQVGADGSVSDYATGLTTLTDVTAAPDGNLYAVQFAEFTDQGPTPNSGQIIRVKEGDASEVVVSGLSFPTSIDFDAEGNAYVTTNGVGAPGSGEVVRFANLTGQPAVAMVKDAMAGIAAEGEAMAAEEEAMAAEPEAAAPAAETATEAAPAVETPAALPATGGDTAAGISVALLVLGSVMLTGGLLMRRRRSSAS